MQHETPDLHSIVDSTQEVNNGELGVTEANENVGKTGIEVAEVEASKKLVFTEAGKLQAWVYKF